MSRLLSIEVDKRIDIALDKSIRSDNVRGIMKFGKKNDYPQLMERIIDGSVTAKSASGVYSKFLCGAGFEEEQLNKIVVAKDNRGRDIRMIELLRQAASSISYNNGLYFHININRNMEIGTVKNVPFKDCRFANIDDRGYTSKIGVYDNWTKETNTKFDKTKISWFPIFSRNEDAFIAQVSEYGGFKNYPGQIYFFFFDNQYLYPLSPFDQVYMDADTEFQIQLFKNRSIRNGLMDKTILRIQSPNNDTEREELIDKIESFIGADGDSVLVLEDELDNETGEIREKGAFKADTIKSNINSRLFDTWETGLANNIRKAMSALPALLIDYEQGKLGTTSGESIIQATNFYNQVTKSDRMQLSEIFREIFSNSANKELATNINWDIKELKLYENGASANL